MLTLGSRQATGTSTSQEARRLSTVTWVVVLATLGRIFDGYDVVIYGFVANYYRTNVRAAGVAWCAGFGRLGGIGGPMLGSTMIGAGFQLDSIFCVLAGLGLLGVMLTLLVPMARSQVVSKPARSASAPAPAVVAAPLQPTA